MDAIEESVRRALEGGDPSDQTFRRSIYAASARALERLIASRGQTGDVADAERMRVGDILERVEAEYSAYYGGDGLGAQSPSATDAFAEPHTVPDAASTPAAEASVPASSSEPAAAERRPASFAPPAETRADPDEAEVWKPGAQTRSAPRRRPGRTVVTALVVLVVLAALLVLAVRSLGPAGAPEPQAAAEGEAQTAASTSPPGPAGAPSWINVFSGASLEQVSTPEGGRVTSVDEAGRSAIRVSGPDGGEGEILINLGPGLVGSIAGSQVRVELVAGSPDGELREFSVRCLFAQDSVCARQRFATSMREEAFVFDVPIPSSAGNPANLAIGPGLSADGRDVDVYSVRMRVL